MKPINLTFAAPRKNVLNISNLKGIDLTNSPSNVSENRSPYAPNMIRCENGRVRKRVGYSFIKKYEGKICGVYRLGKKEIIHAGTKLYEGDNVIYEDMAEERSRAWVINNKLYILDGKTYLVYDGETAKTVSSEAYIPTVIIAKNPEGGGTPLEPINLLSTKWKETFYGKENIKLFQLSFADLDDTPVEIKKLGKDGTWQVLSENTDFSVNRLTGQITFTAVPGETPAIGTPNIEITASKIRDGYAGKINMCSISAVYGVNGASDRLFVAGNPKYPNQDYYSQINDPTYFGDTWYSVLGQSDSKIMGYSIINDRLAVHKSVAEDGRNVILRTGTLLNGTASFPIVNALQGLGATAKHSFKTLGKEPLFLTNQGIYAITAEDVTGEKYSQARSFFVDGQMLEEKNLQDAYAYVYKDFYMLCINNKIYILDGLQKSYERDKPYSTYQYECYLWLDLAVYTMWEHDGFLYFGTASGEIFRFFKDISQQESYSDNGKAITAYWDLPELDGKEFYQNKTFDYFAVRLASAVATGTEIFVQKQGIWHLILDEKLKARYFDWSKITWSKWSWSTDKTPRTIGNKIKVKKVDKARFRIQNKELSEPFGIYSIALEYTENGKYK